MLLMDMTLDEAIEIDKRLSNAWLAGLIDGEGWVGISKHNYAAAHRYRLNDKIVVAYLPVISIQMTHEKTIKRVAKLTNLPIDDWARQGRPNCKILFRWRIMRWEKTRQVLEQIRPYVFTKKPQVEKVIEFMDKRKFQRTRPGAHRGLEDVEYCERYYRLLREMNRRGILQNNDVVQSIIHKRPRN